MPCSSLCSLVSLSSHSLPVLQSSITLSKSFVLAHDLLLLILYCSLISFYLSTLFVPIKVLCRMITKDWIHCAPLPIVV